jgi:hypothetical protein
MTDPVFLELYEQHRRKHQLDWYRSRYREFEKANRQAGDISSILLLLTTMVSLLAGAGFATEAGLEKLWAVLAVVLPALSTALAAYRGLYAFQEQAKLYRDAALTLQVTRAQAPDFAPDGSEVQGTTLDPEAYVLRVEEVFRLEQGQWGQIAAEIRPAPGHVRAGAEEAGGDAPRGTDPGGGGRRPAPGTRETPAGEATEVPADAPPEAETEESTPPISPSEAPGTMVITAATASSESSLAAEEGGVAVPEAEEPGLAPAQEAEPTPEEAPAGRPPPEEERG